MGAVSYKIRKKFRRLYPVMVEGKFFRRIGNCFKEFFTWLDRKIGYQSRKRLWKHTETVQNRIMFFPFSHTVGCNLKYISDELIRRQAPVDIWWSVTNVNTRLDAAEIAAKDHPVTDTAVRLAKGHKAGGKKLAEWLETEAVTSDDTAASSSSGTAGNPEKVSSSAKSAGKDPAASGKSAPGQMIPTREDLVAAQEIVAIQNYIGTHVHFIKTNVYEYFQAAAASKVLFTNSLLGDKFYPFPTREDQIVAQTWHGSLGIKRFDPAHYNTNVTWPIAAARTGKLTTHIISNSTFEDAVFRETFWPETPILKLGHARNDIFFPQSVHVRDYLRHAFCREHELDEKTKFALYAPTFRDDHNFAVYDLDAEQTVHALEKRFGGKWKLLLRYHDNDKKNETKKNTVKSGDVIDVTKYPDMQSLLAFTDCGITDYSSWIYDYILLRRPGFIFAMDRDQYNNERGFYFKLEDTPFPVAVDSDELEEKILAFDEKVFQEKITAFLADKGCMDDGNASVRIADQVLEWMK